MSFLSFFVSVIDDFQFVSESRMAFSYLVKIINVDICLRKTKSGAKQYHPKHKKCNSICFHDNAYFFHIILKFTQWIERAKL
jgi:hypothetical protein